MLLGPYLTLCLSEDEYKAATRKLEGETPEGTWLSDHATAQVHTFSCPGKGPVCVVCIRPDIYALEAALTFGHEALHIFRRWLDYIGEESPGEEIEAHAIKGIAVSLVDEYERRREC
jgi:hypothetical protein